MTLADVKRVIGKMIQQPFALKIEDRAGYCDEAFMDEVNHHTKKAFDFTLFN